MRFKQFYIAEENKKIEASIDKLIEITNGKDDKDSKEINKMAQGLKKTYDKEGGISKEQAQWLYDTWKSFNG